MNRQINTTTGICFFKVTDPVSLEKFLSELSIDELQLKSSPDLAREWLRFGSLYLDGQRQIEEATFQPGQVLRLHTRRKSYWDESRDLTAHVVLDQPGFFVFDKPAGLPTHPTLDNFVENAQTLLSRQLGIKVFVTHRLDVATSGLLIFAKTPECQRGLNRVFSRGRVKKKYRALTASPVTEGVHTHFINPEGRIPREVSSTPVPNWWNCSLEVERCTPHEQGFLSDIRLITGKTHQIRSQLSHMGAAILGDEVYGSTKAWPPAGIALECLTLEFQLGPESFTVTRPKSLAK